MEAIRPSSRTILVADLTEGELPALSKITFTIPSPTVDTHKVVSFNSLMECTYFCKYQKDGAQELCPAPITDEQWHTVGELALRRPRPWCHFRADFILDEEGRFWLLPFLWADAADRNHPPALR